MVIINNTTQVIHQEIMRGFLNKEPSTVTLEDVVVFTSIVTGKYLGVFWLEHVLFQYSRNLEAMQIVDRLMDLGFGSVKSVQVLEQVLMTRAQARIRTA